MRKTIKIVIIMLLGMTIPSIVAAAGIAIVEAPEQSMGICAARNVAEAFACARKKCAEGGAAEADCFEIAYCDYGWTVDVFVQAREGNHWHEFHCGWKTRAEAEAAGKLVCNPERMRELMECSTAQIYDPEAMPRIEN